MLDIPRAEETGNKQRYQSVVCGFGRGTQQAGDSQRGWQKGPTAHDYRL